jgi:hypothetical protein
MKQSATRKPSHPRADELHERRAVAERARKEYDEFASEFSRKHLQDHRLSRAGLVLVDGNTRDDSHPSTEERRAAERQRLQDDFHADSQRREQLRRAALDAERALTALESAIAEEVDEASERAELAAAIKTLSERKVEADRLRKANARARVAVDIAKTKAHDAAAAINAAIDYHTKICEAAIEQGFAADRDGMVREARSEAAAAEDDLTAAQRAEEAVRTKLANAEGVLEEAGEAVVRMAGRILTVGLPDLLAAAAASRTEMIGREKVLRYLAQFAPPELRRDVETFLATPWLWDHTPAERHPAVTLWLSTRTALMTDADAPLPQ